MLHRMYICTYVPEAVEVGGCFKKCAINCSIRGVVTVILEYFEHILLEGLCPAFTKLGGPSPLPPPLCTYAILYMYTLSYIMLYT